MRAKFGGFLAFLAVGGLVAGGLGWVTREALRLEQEQADARAETERGNTLRVALWRLDSLVYPVLAKEAGRPYNHYSPFFAPPLALRRDGTACAPGSVLQPSPLLTAELPDWMLLHFQCDATEVTSPQVLPPEIRKHLAWGKSNEQLANVTPQREKLLQQLRAGLSFASLSSIVRRNEMTTQEIQSVLFEQRFNQEEPVQQAANTGEPQNTVQTRGAPTKTQQSNYAGNKIDPEYASRMARRSDLSQNVQKQVYDSNDNFRNSVGKSADWFTQKFDPSDALLVPVRITSMNPLWLGEANSRQWLVVSRVVEVDGKSVCQGIVLDWPRLRAMLAAEVSDLFETPDLRPALEPVPEHPERTMTALPVELVPPGITASIPVTEWTPLRVGLALAWLAALGALLAVFLGGWSLIDLSQRRIRFVSAVTHELRTPLTTLRLYLDMLTGGLVAEEKRDEYLNTLNAETDRLHRLVSNVLDFSRLENQRPRLECTQACAGEVLDLAAGDWAVRARDCGKQLIVEKPAEPIELRTDVKLVGQVLANLIDNACKYTRDAEDPAIRLRARRDRGQVVFEVEDRGPGVPQNQRRSIFRAFRRGDGADTIAGGVGLGLALAKRWAGFLGGRLTVDTGSNGLGACFRLELPASK